MHAHMCLHVGMHTHMRHIRAQADVGHVRVERKAYLVHVGVCVCACVQVGARVCVN